MDFFHAFLVQLLALAGYTQGIDMTIPNTVSPHPGPQTQFLSSPADIAIYGGQAGGGKTWALLAEAVRYTHNPHYGAVIFRRTSPQITNEGGLWDESMLMYPQLGGKPKVGTLDWKFESGANISFRHLQHETDKLAWQGSQVAMIGFDELTHFTESQFFYMLSRNRSTSGVKPYVRATCNPVPECDPIGGWVNRLIAWWIDQSTGLAIAERSGVERWFIRFQGELVWAATKRELIEQYGRTDLSDDDPQQSIQPKSLTFIPAKLEDNPTLMVTDPSYRANLLALPDVERKRLAEGNWNAKPRSGVFFKVAKIEIVNALPATLRYCRAWDLAATEGSGDWTVGAKLGRDSEGVYYIVDIQRGQWETSYRDKEIRQAAVLDGTCPIRIPQDPGAAGKSEARRMVIMLAGFPVKTVLVTGDKATRASGFASQLNVGNVKMLAATWNHGLLQRLDAFPSANVPDDEIDALSDAFDELAFKRNVVIGMGSSSPP